MSTYCKIIFKDGEPCDHPGCKNHVTHPCEGCGRKMAKGTIYSRNKLGVVLDCTEAFRGRQIQNVFDQLSKLADLQESNVFDDPFKAMELAYNHLHEVQKAIDDIREVFSGELTPFREDVPIEFESRESIMHRKLDKIYDIISRKEL